jgi:hypothetical protein
VGSGPFGIRVCGQQPEHVAGLVTGDLAIVRANPVDGADMKKLAL